jgi:hypothetical protein
MKAAAEYMELTFSPWSRRDGEGKLLPVDFPERYGDWDRGFPGSKPGPFGIPKYLSGSDYSGSLVERSNRDVWAEEFAEGRDNWWAEVHGGHGTFAIVVKLDALPDDALEFLARLDEYPLADEDAHSHLEIEAQGEAWEDWGRGDFKVELDKRAGDEGKLGDVENDKLYTLFYAVSERIGEYWVNEQGDSMAIDIKRIAKAVTDEELADVLS